MPDDTSQPQNDTRALYRTAAPIIILILGAYLAFTIPAFGPADELAHVCRAWQIAHGGLNAEHGIDAASNPLPAGGQVPASILATERPMKAYYFQSGKPVPPDVLADQASHELAPETTEYYSFPNSAVYTPLVYLQFVPAMWAGHVLNLRVVTTVRLARLSNVLFAAALVWALLRLCPAYHGMAFLLLCLPTTIGLFSSVTADAVTLLVSIAWVIWCLRLRAIGESTLSRRDWLITLALAAALPLCKFPYAPLILLWLITPPAVAVGRAIMLRRAALVLAVGVAAFIYTALLYLPNSRSGYSDSRVADQLKYCLDHPLAFPSAVLNVLEHSAVGLVGSTIGGFGHNDAYISGFWVIVLVAVAAIAIAIAPSPFDWTWRDRAVLVAGSGICLSAVFGFLYVAWSQIGAAAVNGITGRYLLPTLLPLFLAAGNHQYRDHHPRRTAWIVITLYALAAIGAATAVHTRYHG